MITAIAADDLKQAGAVAFVVMHDPGRLLPQAGCPAVSGLASKREWPLGVDAEPRPRRSTQPAHGGGGVQTRRRSGIRRDIWLFGAAHSSPGLVCATAGVWSSVIVDHYDTQQFPRSKSS
jgi:hypothetical protein